MLKCMCLRRRSEIKLSNVWCIYGYSLTIFIPMAFVCIVPIGWVRWLVVGLATGATPPLLLLLMLLCCSAWRIRHICCESRPAAATEHITKRTCTACAMRLQHAAHGAAAFPCT